MPVKQIWRKRKEEKKNKRPAAWSYSCCLTHTVPVCTLLLHSSLPFHPSRWKQLLGPDVAGLTSGWGGVGGDSSHFPPWPLAPERSPRRPSPRTSARQWQPDGTCSSAPRPLSSTVWSPAWEAGRGWVAPGHALRSLSKDASLKPQIQN